MGMKQKKKIVKKEIQNGRLKKTTPKSWAIVAKISQIRP